MKIGEISSVTEGMPNVRWLLQLLLNPGWAPLAVVALHVVLAEFGLTDRFDHLLHFLGGVSITYFLYGFFGALPAGLLELSRRARLLLTFTSGCTVAVFWEFAEFSADKFMRTNIQLSVSETMLDLVFGVVGGTIVTVLFSLFGKRDKTVARL